MCDASIQACAHTQWLKHGEESLLLVALFASNYISTLCPVLEDVTGLLVLPFFTFQTVGGSRVGEGGVSVHEGSPSPGFWAVGGCTGGHSGNAAWKDVYGITDSLILRCNGFSPLLRSV